MKPTSGLTLGFAAVASGVLLAGCGGGAKAPSVASLGTTPSSNSRSSSSSLFPTGVGGNGASMSTEVGTGAAGMHFAACMRSHGVPGFPDPDSRGTLTITVSPSLNPSAPVFQRAEGVCQRLLPATKPLIQARQQQMQQRLLALAACMRSQGFPHYPDPTFGHGGMVSQGIGRNDGIDPRSPIYQTAQKTCQANHVGGG
jgi:hypothetical protein